MRVKARKVTRFFVDGRGYGSIRAAYIAIAKAELGKAISARAYALRDGDPEAMAQFEEAWARMDKFDIFGEPKTKESELAFFLMYRDLKPYISAAYAEMFPIHETRSDANEQTPPSFSYHKHLDGDGKGAEWCNGCRWLHIAKRAKELQAEDERAPLALPQRCTA